MRLGNRQPAGARNGVFRAAALAVLALAVGPGAGCAGRSVPGPAAPELPEEFTAASADGSHEPREWWRAFSDPTLDRVVETALASNFSVAEAVARVRQARSRARLADAAVLPAVGARAGADTFDQPVNAAIGAQLEDLGLDFPLPERLGFPIYSVSADFAYEVDFWGRARHDALAAGSELLASEFDLATARIGVLAETIAAYFEIGHLRRQLDIARRQVALAGERERWIASRHARGIASPQELSRAEQARLGAEAGVPQLENRLGEAESRLAVLLGAYREDLTVLLPDSRFPEPVAEPAPAGIPADLLLQRPDVRAAGHRLEAAGHAVEARRAALMPQLSLSGSIGLLSPDAGGLFDVGQWFTRLAGNLFRPVFDGGRLATGVELAEARFDERAAAYGRTVVTAVNEVEAAVDALRNEGSRRESLAAQHAEAEDFLDLQSRRYRSGVGRYTDVLDADRALLEVESAVAGSDRSLALARLAIHRALGGAWTAPDRAAPDQPAPDP